MIGIGISIPINKYSSVGGGVAPSNSVAPVASVPYAIAGQTLSCTTGTWSGDAPITYSYQWQSSSDGSTGWANVGGATSSTYVIPSSAAQLLFYRCVVTGTNAFGANSANSNVIGGVDSQANTHFNRVTADSGVMTYGLVGVDTYTKTLKYIYNVSDINTKFNYVRHLDYIGYKAGSGTGLTAGKSVQKVYSLTGANYDLVQNTVASQPFLAAWSPNENFITKLQFGNNNVTSTAKALANNSKITLTLRFRKITNFNVNSIIHGTATTLGNFNWALGWALADIRPFLTIADGTIATATSGVGASFNGWVRVVAENSGSDMLVTFLSSTDNITYTQLGAQVTLTGKSGQIGSTSRVLSFALTGAAEYLSFVCQDSTNAIIFNLNPNEYNRSVSQTSWNSSSGETYTVNIDIGTNLKIMIVDQTMIQGNGTSMGMQAASATINTEVFTQYNVWRKYVNTLNNSCLNEYGANIASNSGLAFYTNDPASTDALYTNSNVGLNGTSWQSTSVSLKLSTFRGDVNGTPYEQGLSTNNVANTFNAVQSSLNNTTAIIATGDNLLARNNAASLWINAVWVAGHLTTATDSSTEATNVYNYLADLTNII